MRRFGFLIMVGLALVAAEIPFVGWPLKWVETFFHEISHGLAALATGGRVLYFVLNYDGSGLLYSAGGWPVVVAFAGYAGASLWGLALFRTAGAASPSAGREWAVFGAIVVALCWVLWGRGVSTLVVSAVITALFGLAAFAGRAGLARQALAFVGVSIALSALRSPLVLLVFGGQSDARSLASMTLIPRVLWVFAWCAIALLVLWRMWRLSGRLPLFRGGRV